MTSNDLDDLIGRFESFKLQFETALKIRGSELSNFRSGRATVKDVMNVMSPKMYMVMIFEIIFEIRTPDNINIGLKPKIKKEYLREIDRFIKVRQFDSMDLINHKKNLENLLDLLDLPSDANFDSIITILNSIEINVINIGQCVYLDKLFEILRDCTDFLIDIYAKNLMPRNCKLIKNKMTNN